MHELFREYGYKVFPLHKIVDGKCACGNPECHAAGKHPTMRSWQHTPEWSDEQWEFMTDSRHGVMSNYGVLMDGLLVVDVDARNGGVDSIGKLLEDIPQIAGAGLIVETGSGGGSRHMYFSLPGGAALSSHLQDYPGIDFKSSGFVVGPGSMHISGRQYVAVSGDPSDIEPAPQALIDLLIKPDHYRTESGDVNDSDIADMLSYINPDVGYDDWIKIGMAIHHTANGAGLELWDTWSKGGKKYPGYGVIERHWHSFGKSSSQVTIGTLFYIAEQAGWCPSVEIAPAMTPEEIAEEVAGDAWEQVDLQRPPGFVGELVEWVNSRSRFPRERLAVMAAFVGLGNACGLRYLDVYSPDTTPNLFAFGVAGSGTGKEAVLQSAQEIMRMATVGAGIAGGFKSEQEIVRNLIRHQSVFYVVDEMGEQLRKIVNARSAYLEGIIGALMEIYPKASSAYSLTGDKKEEVLKELANELKRIDYKIENNEGDRERLEQRRERISNQVDVVTTHGITAPFLSVMGLTTPVVFNELMTYEQATNGFIARSLLAQERDNNPRRKKGFRKPQTPPHIEATLISIATGGHADIYKERIEYEQERISIDTTDDAALMLDEVEEYFWNQADHYRGMEAIPRRGFELVMKVSLILAIPGRVRTVEHVQWAYAYIRRDIKEKLELTTANDLEERKQLSEALVARIFAVIGDEEMYGSKIVDTIARRKHYKKEDIKRALEALATDGRIEAITTGRATKFKMH